MPYITTAERLGIEQGLRRGVLSNLAVRFGELPGAMRGELDAVYDLEQLEDLLRQALQVSTLEEFRAYLRSLPHPADG